MSRCASSPNARALSMAALLGLLVPSCLTAQSDRRTLAGDSVALFNVAGSVRIERGTGRDVTFDITRRGRDADRLRIETGTVRGLPTLRVIYPGGDIVYRGGTSRGRWSQTEMQDDGTWGGRWSGGRRVKVKSSGEGVEAWADIRVMVPAGHALEAHLLVGDMTATDVDASLVLDVSAAAVTVDRMDGSLAVDAGSGGVSLRDVRSARLTVDNGSGGVTMRDVRGDRCSFDLGSGAVDGANVSCQSMTVDVGSGSVRFTESSARTVKVDAGSGGVSLDLRTAPSSVEVDAGSGPVTLSLPSSIGATLDIDTGSGGISTDFPIRTDRVERNRLRGTIGNGNAQIRVETGSGAVRIRRGGT